MPSIIDGLFAGRSGIQSQGTGISVLADNIANANTTAFKQSRADFADLVAGTLAGGSGNTPGSGSQVLGITPILTQGTFEFTGRGLDLGIDGQGYFVVQDTQGTGQRLYSRAGNFKIDTDGNLLNQNGYQVLGFPATGAGGLAPLNVNKRATGSVETKNSTIGGNLDASSPSNALVTTNFQSLSDSAQYATTIDVYDTLGASHSVTVYFGHTTTPGVWDVRGYVDAGTAGGIDGQPLELFNTHLNFGTGGAQTALSAPNPVSNAITFNGAAPSSIKFDLTGFKSFATKSSISNISQDGTGTGNVVGFQVEETGNVFAQLDNGQTASIGYVALASFANPEGLRRVGGSLFAQSSSAGEPVIGKPSTGNLGSIESGALELSNADIASDFIKLISFQRGFQGSSRIITNINDLLQEIVNLA